MYTPTAAIQWNAHTGLWLAHDFRCRRHSRSDRPDSSSAQQTLTQRATYTSSQRRNTASSAAIAVVFDRIHACYCDYSDWLGVACLSYVKHNKSQL